MKTLNDLLNAAKAQSPGKTAYITPSRRMTFGELHDHVAKIASGLRRDGVRERDCVAIVLRNGVEFITGYLALARIGAVAVPINFMVQVPDELAYMLNDCKAVGVVTQGEFLPGLRKAIRATPSVRRLWVTDAAPSECRGIEKPFHALLSDEVSPPATAGGEDTAAILYTSGTTGQPKGVMLTHRNLVTNAISSVDIFRLNSDDSNLCVLPMFHSFAWTGCVLVSLALRATLVIAPSIVPAAPWLKMMGRHGVTVMAAVPQLYAVLAKEARGLKRLIMKYIFFRRVRIAISGAAPLSASVARAFEESFGVPICEGYGLTETSPVATANTPWARRLGSVGKAIPGVAVKIIDDDERVLDQGREGEICVKGDNVMKGYYNMPEATREIFTRDGWLKTGDIGVLDAEGFVYIRDRKKDMIIVKGLKVFSAQVEAKLLEHPAVAEAAIIGVPDEHGDEMIKAFVVLQPGARAGGAGAEASDLAKHCRERIDAYKRPRAIEIVESLPKNALQKVLKRELRRLELEKRQGLAPP
ncbi:MAG: long-chain-fatty-acid--CoA ligase [Elusimicrobia bacterium]|nr:long-chain-fatty-acid--CoA ligase [Elusimicrobiota bacterium]